MTSSTTLASTRSVLCSICARRVNLETSKTNEWGEAVHEHCYVRKTIAMLRPQMPDNLSRCLIEWSEYRLIENLPATVIRMYL